jgi:hypothetical protein
MDEIISYKMCAVKVRNAKLRNYLNHASYREETSLYSIHAVYCSKILIITGRFLLRPWWERAIEEYSWKLGKTLA